MGVLVGGDVAVGGSGKGVLVAGTAVSVAVGASVAVSVAVGSSMAATSAVGGVVGVAVSAPPQLTINVVRISKKGKKYLRMTVFQSFVDL